MNEFEDLGAEAGELSLSVADASDITRAFSRELDAIRGQTQSTVRDLGALERNLTGGVRRAIDEVVLDGGRLRDALSMVGEAISSTAYRSAMKPVSEHIGGALARGIDAMVGGVLPFANGAPFSQGRVMPFATGGVVDGPVRFPMRGGTGLMGEAGPEAIMPLTRTADGRLGVAASGGGGRPVSVTINVSSPDVAGFRRSKGQIAGEVSRAIAHSQRNR